MMWKFWSGIRIRGFHGGEEVHMIGFPQIGGNAWAVTKGTLSGFDGPILKFSGAVEGRRLRGDPSCIRGRSSVSLWKPSGNSAMPSHRKLPNLLLETGQALAVPSMPNLTPRSCPREAPRRPDHSTPGWPHWSSPRRPKLPKCLLTMKWWAARPTGR